MKAKLIRSFLALLALYLGLFLGRWAYLFHLSQIIRFAPTNTYTSTNMGVNQYIDNIAPVNGQIPYQFYGYDGADVSDFADFKLNGAIKSAASAFVPEVHNYAREGRLAGGAAGIGGSFGAPIKLKGKVYPAPQNLPPQESEETYEKIGSLSAWSRDFDNDEKKVRSAIASHQVLIQQEENSGLAGSRLLNLALGVVPEKFDAVMAELQKIGNLISFRVTKTDKTNDYRSLMAQRASIEKNRADLLALKKRSGKMSELLDLQQKIFDIDDNLKDLGLQIGHFEGQASLCTIALSLREIGPAPLFWAFAVPALDWAVGEFFAVFFYFLVMGFTVLLTAFALAKGAALRKELWSRLDRRPGGRP